MNCKTVWEQQDDNKMKSGLLPAFGGIL